MEWPDEGQWELEQMGAYLGAQPSLSFSLWLASENVGLVWLIFQVFMRSQKLRFSWVGHYCVVSTNTICGPGNLSIDLTVSVPVLDFSTLLTYTPPHQVPLQSAPRERSAWLLQKSRLLFLVSFSPFPSLPVFPHHLPYLIHHYIPLILIPK